MNIIKNKLRERYTQLPTMIIEDVEISALSFRVLSYLFSKDTGWKFTIKTYKTN